jgi:hypothetical protein
MVVPPVVCVRKKWSPATGLVSLSLNTYFVRKIADDEVVGLFVASSAAALAALVDEHCDPASCEYATAFTGGLIVPTITKAKWPMKAGRTSRSTGLEAAVLTQQWEDDLDAETTLLEWKPLQQAAERMLHKLGKREGD